MRFLLANGLLFFTMTGVLYIQYFYQSPDAAVAVASVTQLRSPAATSGNLPAVIETKTSLLEKKPADLDWKYNLACQDSEKEVSQSRNSMILNLKKCGKEFPKDIVIENQTNGFTASVFPISDSNVKTDSIPLKKGRNVVVIKYIHSKSKVEIVEKLSIQH
ncbi:MAG: hypothetical protein B7Y39_03465 [Bdellovibrio sp. 28-41-41]|nr:MAG: hypothetical protein B7Y39_03465 [Bdellovibrio sp. 28-41-41]